ncbi:MAG: putative transposase [Pseudomonadales bacterium]
MGGRGSLITTQMRITVIDDVNKAVEAGSRRSRACELVGLAQSTLKRWQPKDEDTVRSDQRPLALKPAPSNKLSEPEQQHILAICNESAYSHLPPSQILPQLAEKGVYVARESSFYRVLKAHGQLKHRGRAKQKQTRIPDTHIALEPNAVGHNVFGDAHYW